MRIEGRGREYGVIHLRCEREEEVVEFAGRELGLSEGQVRDLLSLGAIYVNDQRIDENRVLALGTDVRVHTQPRRFNIPSLKIVHKTSDFLIIDKPPGVPVHALTDNSRENILVALARELGCQVFITHRLDIETSGLLLVALNDQAQREINRKIAEKSIQRIYTAWVERALGLGEYIHYMEPSPTAPKRVSSQPASGWQECRLRIIECKENQETLLSGNPFALPHFSLRIELMTGRTQQIRAQLAALGCPILGDVLYGGVSAITPKAIALRASSIRIDGITYSDSAINER